MDIDIHQFQANLANYAFSFNVINNNNVCTILNNNIGLLKI